VTAINQDSLGVQGIPIASQISSAATASCWFKPLADGSTAVILLNAGDSAATISCALSDLGVKGTPTAVRDLWAKAKFTGVVNGGKISAQLDSHAHSFVTIK
jgi:alpha-galactosidase